MVIEHTFVTTVPCRDALTAASAMLGHGGFVAEGENAFRVGETEWTSIQMMRGKKSIAKAKDPSECPQRVLLHWDRGRVTVAASIEPKVRSTAFSYRGAGYGSLTNSGLAMKSGKRTKDFSDLMIAISLGLEALLVARQPAETASQGWFALETTLKEKARKARRRSWIFAGVFLAIIVGLIAFIAIMANTH